MTTTCPHTDAERAVAGCPVCLRAERDALVNAPSDIAPWQDAATKLNELPSLPSVGDVSELIKEACLACAKGTGSYGRAAEMFDNSEAIIKSNYQGRVNSEDTRAFYALAPTAKKR